MSRRTVTITRNDIRPRDFKRWTVWCGQRALFDIEATLLVDSAIVSVRNLRGKRGDVLPGAVLKSKRVPR